MASFGENHRDWTTRYRCEWGLIVGTRVRRLRENRKMMLRDLAGEIYRSNGIPYSSGFVSRLERGWASPPLWVYIRIAEIFEVEAGDLLGRDGVESPVSEAELTLVRVLREVGLSPEAAIARLLGDGSSRPVA